MAIGKPLLVTERQGVAQPVLTPQTQQLSSNVPVQKIALADYNIGMQNVKSSFAVSDELANMVDAGIKAKLYIDNTKAEYRTLNLMSEWDTVNQQAKQEYAQALTLEAKEVVTQNYNNQISGLKQQWGESVVPTPDNQTRLAQLTKAAGDQYSRFYSSNSALLNNLTNSQLDAQLNTEQRKMSDSLNADMLVGLKTLDSLLTKKVAIGAETTQGALLKRETLRRQIMSKRITLSANKYADELSRSGDVPTEEGMLASMGHIQMEIPDEIRPSVTAEYEAQYIKAITDSNTKIATEETYMKNAYRKNVAAATNDISIAISSGVLTVEDYDSLKNEIESWPSILVDKKNGLLGQLEGWFRGTANPVQVDDFAGTQALNQYRARPELYNNGIWNMENVSAMLDGFDTNPGTVVAMRNKFLAENVAATKERGSDLTTMSNSIVSELIKSSALTGFLDTFPGLSKDFLEVATLGGNPRTKLPSVLHSVLNSVESEVQAEQRNQTNLFDPNFMEANSYSEWSDKFRANLQTRIENAFFELAKTQDTEQALADEAKKAQAVKDQKAVAAEKKIQLEAQEKERQSIVEANRQKQAKQALANTPKMLLAELSDLKKKQDLTMSDVIHSLELEGRLHDATGGITLGSKKHPWWTDESWDIITDSVAEDLRTIHQSVGNPLASVAEYAEGLGTQAMSKWEQSKLAVVNGFQQIYRQAIQSISSGMLTADELEDKYGVLPSQEHRNRAFDLLEQAGWPEKFDPKTGQINPIYSQIEDQLQREFPVTAELSQREERTPSVLPQPAVPLEPPPLESLVEAVKPVVEQVVGKGLWASMTDQERDARLSDTGETKPSDLPMSDFLAKYYNAADPEQQKEYSGRAKERFAAYSENRLSKYQHSNLTQMLAILNKAKSSFIEDLNYLQMPYSEFLDHMISIYGAETNFGTDKKRVSTTDVVGEIQVTRGTFREVVKPDGNFGPKMAKAAGYSLAKIRELARPENDQKLRKLLLQDNRLNFIAGAAILLSKLQYN